MIHALPIRNAHPERWIFAVGVTMTAALFAAALYTLPARLDRVAEARAKSNCLHYGDFINHQAALQGRTEPCPSAEEIQ